MSTNGSVALGRPLLQNPSRIFILDLDSSVSPTLGDKEGTAYNGRFGCTCYHPLFVFTPFGDLKAIWQWIQDY